MAKNYQPIQVPQLDLESPSPKELIDWSLCALCQKSKKENLVCPARKAPAAGYTYVAENLEQFQEMGHNPLDASLSRLDEGNGFESAFREHSASWHKPCFSKVSTTVLDRKRKQRECSSAASPVKSRRATGTSSAPLEQDASEDMEAQAGTSKKPRLYFFCNKPATYGDGVLHEMWTTQVYHNVYSHAIRINGSTVLRKLANTDMAADDCMYHLKYLTRHYRKKPKDQEDEREDETTKLQAVALAQVVAYIESCRDDSESRPLFYMSDLCDLYASHLKDFGLHVPERVHSGRLREKFLAVIPDLFSAQEGRNVVLLFNRDLGAAMKEASTRDSEVVQLARAAELATVDRRLTEDTIASLQRLVVLMYDRSSTLTTVDAARQTLFARKSKSLENIPPTEAALRQNILRAVLQSGLVWGQSLEKEPHLPSPGNWGWKRKDTNPWMPFWPTLEPAQDACKELVKCGCRQGCRGRCSCRKANLLCTALCFCSGDCALED